VRNSLRDLLREGCAACKIGDHALDAECQLELLKQLNSGWSINEAGHLCKEYRFKNFIQTIHFANQISTIAEKQFHHPKITISWGRCKIEIWTHKISALSENDFILAAKIEAIKELQS